MWLNALLASPAVPILLYYSFKSGILTVCLYYCEYMYIQSHNGIAQAQKGSTALMKAVAAALVLIIVAVVILWYGNTLNSWVLGGLIGGLAALLFSIPISLMLFSFFSRRHDERLHSDAAEVYDDEANYSVANYRALRPRVAREEHIRTDYREEYIIEEERAPRRHVWDEEEEVRYQQSQHMRRLPEPGYARLPAPRQRPSTRDLSDVPPSQGATQSRQLETRGGKENTSRRPTPRRMNYPGFPGYQVETSHSQMRSQAMRTARLEAARQREEELDEGDLPAHLSRRPVTDRFDRSSYDRSSYEQSYEQEEEDPTFAERSYRRASQSLERTQRGARNYSRRPIRIIDSTPTGQDVPRSLPRGGEGTSRRGYQGNDQDNYQEDPETDAFDTTGQDLQRPLVRRAPYMYADDPLRKKLSQQLDSPIVRRSSRKLIPPPDEE